MTDPYHSVESVSQRGAKAESICVCGWRSGNRVSRQAALVALSGHIDAMRLMPLARAEQILNDHAHGLHEEHDGPDGCGWFGCSDAAFVVARDRERRPDEKFS